MTDDPCDGTTKTAYVTEPVGVNEGISGTLAKGYQDIPKSEIKSIAKELFKFFHKTGRITKIPRGIFEHYDVPVRIKEREDALKITLRMLDIHNKNRKKKYVEIDGIKILRSDWYTQIRESILSNLIWYKGLMDSSIRLVYPEYYGIRDLEGFGEANIKKFKECISNDIRNTVAHNNYEWYYDGNEGIELYLFHLKNDINRLDGVPSATLDELCKRIYNLKVMAEAIFEQVEIIEKQVKG